MLYLVGTPIGNMQDVTLRSLDVLKKVHVIACEDTRRSAPFLNFYDIHTPLISYHKFNEKEQSANILEMLRAGKDVALITDAGMPCISDPGAVVVKEARKNGLEIQVVPGPSAVVSAVSLVGLDTGYVFIGFLPDKKGEAKQKLAPFVYSPLPLVFYCGCHDLDKVPELLYEVLGERDMAVVKELTKMHETVTETTLSQGYDGDTRGEFVLVVSGYVEKEDWSKLTVEDHIKSYLNLGVSKKEAVKKVAAERNVKKDEIYKIAINIKEKQ